MIFTPDNELLDIWRAESYTERWRRSEAVKVFKRIRSDKLKADAAQLKKKLIDKKGACEICGFSFKPVLQIHHILPISQGGNNSLENIVCVCPTCHKTLHYAYSCRNKEDVYGFVNIITYPAYRDGDAIGKIYDISFKYLAMKSDVQRCRERYEHTVFNPSH